MKEFIDKVLMYFAMTCIFITIIACTIAMVAIAYQSVIYILG